MGEVYLATDTRLDRKVAIKVLPAHLTDHPGLKERFDREAKAILTEVSLAGQQDQIAVPADARASRWTSPPRSPWC